MYLRGDLPPKDSPERDLIPGFSLNFGFYPNNFWGGIGYIDICSHEGKEEKEGMLIKLLGMIQNTVSWTKTEKNSFSVSIILSDDSRTFLPSCGNCKAPLLMEKLSRCGNCRNIYYCNKSCQVQNWEIHRRLYQHLSSGLKQMRSSNSDSIKKVK